MSSPKLVKLALPRITLCYLVAVFALAWSVQAITAQTKVPTDADDQTCAVTKSDFGSWFASGTQGFVVPPDSVHFPSPALDECTYYKWSEHMFLWATSPPPPAYGGGSYVFDSPMFYEVSPPSGDQSRTLVAKSRERPDQARAADVSVSQLGPEGEPVLFDDVGGMHKVVYVKGLRNPVIEVEGGVEIEIGGIQIGADGLPIFFNKGGQRINAVKNSNGTSKLLDVSGKVIDLALPPGNTIVANGRRYLLDQSGGAIAAGLGQADGDAHVLMTPRNQLVYYKIHVNDVYAWFLTGKRYKKITAAEFPTGDMDLSAVKRYAGVASFPDEKVLVVELKTAWIELPDASDYANYIWVEADVPDFDISDDKMHGTRKPMTRPARLAMVGMHVAFSVNGHPELIWATFENLHNTPNARYSYDTRDRQVPSQQRCGGSWLFSSGHAEPDGDPLHDPPHNCDNSAVWPCNGGINDMTGACVEANRRRICLDQKGDIDACGQMGETIGPSDVLRINPWGNHEAPAFNTPIIAMNHSLESQFDAGDVRKNYILIGTTWFTDGTRQGANRLANSTMETFVQTSTCLDCHRPVGGDMLGTSNGGKGGGLSHIFGVLDPPFPDPNP
jgi:hypothetical protein